MASNSANLLFFSAVYQNASYYILCKKLPISEALNAEVIDSYRMSASLEDILKMYLCPDCSEEAEI